MRRALRRAAQVFVAAGALGLASPALAQSSHHAGNSALAAAPATDLDEVQVELAWLATPATFHCGLGARVVADVLEVRGYVPTATIKEEALRVARAHTSLAVVDNLQVNPNVSMPINGAPAEELKRQATDLLVGSLGPEAAGLEVTARDDGTVTVKGSVRSLQDKLAVSRTMRKVTGCGAVVNTVRVSQRPGTGSGIVASAPDTVKPPTVAPAAPDAVKPAAVATAAKPVTPEFTPGRIAPVPAPPSGWSDKPAATYKVAAAPVAVVTPPAVDKRPAAVEEKPPPTAYVTTGTVTFDDEPTPTSPPKPPATAPVVKEPVAPSAGPLTAPKLKSQVEAVCGNQARGVEVTMRPDKLMHVIVKTDDMKTQLTLTNKILSQLPEMATPNVRLEFEVGDKK
jgi:BON domain